MLTHDDRQKRRQEIADEAKKLIAEKMGRKDIVTALCQKFMVGTSVVERAFKEADLFFARKTTEPSDPTKPRSTSYQQIAELLKTSILTYRQIAEKIGVTSQYVQIVHKNLLELGYDVPLRKEVLDRVRIAREEAMKAKDDAFVAKYIETNDLVASAADVGISKMRAAKVLRERKLNKTGLIIDDELCKKYPNQRISRRLLYIISDLFDPSLTISSIAEKWKKPSSWVSNLMAECKVAGLQMPKHVDGRRLINGNALLPGTKVPSSGKAQTCEKCGKQFTIFCGNRKGRSVAYHTRKRCYDCKPFVAPKNASKSKSVDSKGLEKSASICEPTACF